MYFEAFNACSLVVIIPLSVTVVEDGVVVVSEPFLWSGKFVRAGCVEVSIIPLP